VNLLVEVGVGAQAGARLAAAWYCIPKVNVVS